MNFEAELLSALDPLIKNEWITEVLYAVKSGKEATVYCCAAHPQTGLDLVAAKIYRSRDHRTFSRDGMYQEGRNFNPTFRRAIAARNKVGLATQFSSWIDHEFATLHRLFRAGADVPRPIHRAGNVLLMEFIGDRQAAAPLLQRVDLRPDLARPLFTRIMHNIELWLSCDRVHGDLSPYNILFWQDTIYVIDLPQSVQPQTNEHAYDLLLRDVENVCSYWARYGVEADAFRIANDLWLRYQSGDL